MSDKEKAFTMLHVASQTCSAALAALRDPSTSVQTPESISVASLDTKLNDYASLLSLLHQNTTKLAIALKPSSLAYSAAITPARELANQADAFASCAYSISEDEHGRTLTREIRWSAEDVLSSMESLLKVYTSEDHAQGGESSSRAAQPYLVRTGVVHEAIEHARGISHTNREAVKKRWNGVLGGLSDCEREVQEMVEEEEEDEHDDLGDFDLDDGWGELGGQTALTKTKASQEELARLKIAQSLFKFTRALMKRIDLIILQATSRVPSPPPKTLDQILSSAEMLLKAADDLVHALYIPQDSGIISRKSKDLATLADALRSDVSSVGLVTSMRESQDDNDLITDLARRTAGITLETLRNGDAAVTKERKWFDTCFEQILKAIAGLT